MTPDSPESHTIPEGRRGFTLVELLAAIAVIAILTALLVKGASRMIESGRRITCAQNLASLGKGFISYMGENQYGLPTPSETSAIEPGASAPTDWIFAVDPYIPYSRKVYICPSNPARFSSDKVSTDRETNYAINYWMREGMITFPMFRARISPLTLPAPSKVALLLDGTASWIKDTQPNRVAFVHQSAANILFLDGHVQTLRKTDMLDASGKVSCLAQPDTIR